MRSRPRSLTLLFAAACAALLIPSCGTFRPASRAATLPDPTVFALSRPGEAIRHFREYRSATGWTFTSTGSEWLEAGPERTERGVPVRVLVRAGDRKTRLSFYETSLPRAVREDRLNEALAYLFQADPLDTPPAKPGAGAGEGDRRRGAVAATRVRVPRTPRPPAAKSTRTCKGPGWPCSARPMTP